MSGVTASPRAFANGRRGSWSLTARACRKFFDAKPGRGKKDDFPAVVNGFTGSSIWHALYAFPPTDQAYLEKGYEDFARRFVPILEAFDQVNVNFALEVHPTEIAFDIASSQRALKALKGHKRFGFNYDPSHLGYQGVDYVSFIRTFADRIFHVHMKDAWWGHGDGSVGVFGGHTDFGDARRFWDFRSLGHGDIDFEEIIVALNDVGLRRSAFGRVGRHPNGSRARRDRSRRLRAQCRFPIELAGLRRGFRQEKAIESTGPFSSVQSGCSRPSLLGRSLSDQSRQETAAATPEVTKPKPCSRSG